jgi:hypothetical protein
MGRKFGGTPARILALAAALLLALMGVVTAQKPAPIKTSASFQSGVGGYDGTVDVELWALAPTTILDTNPNATTDANNDGGESQILLRFEAIVGAKPGQVPPGSAVHSATLIVSAFDQGDTVNLHRMLVPWPRQATWTTMVAGVTADGMEASRHRESFTFGKIAANSSAIAFDVSDSVQAWVNGTPNYGWVFINTDDVWHDTGATRLVAVSVRKRCLVQSTEIGHPARRTRSWQRQRQLRSTSSMSIRSRRFFAGYASGATRASASAM